MASYFISSTLEQSWTNGKLVGAFASMISNGVYPAFVVSLQKTSTLEFHNLELQEQKEKLEKELQEKTKEMKGTMRQLSRMKLFQELKEN